ncbi:hypothetical protein QJQ45_013765, partial [Haematococcus lacustris]
NAIHHPQPCLLVAASFNFQKLFVVDLVDESVHVNSRPSWLDAAPRPPPRPPAPGPPPTQPAQPAPASGAGAGGNEAKAGAAAGGEEAGPAAGGVAGRGVQAAAELGEGAGGGGAGGAAGGGVLAWFEEWGRRLAAGWYMVTPLDNDWPDSKAICLFPLVAEGGCGEAVTRGVRIQASVLFAPEVSQRTQKVFTYSIRFALLSVEEQRELWPAAAGPFVPMTSCQLRARHWIMRDGAGRQKDEVRGEAVVGKYPLLQAGGNEVVYQSCTQQTTPTGSMEGDFRFVAGSIQRPLPLVDGQCEWDCVCPRFLLAAPPFIY